MNENVKQVFNYLDEAKRIYFNIAVIMANNTDIDWNDIFYKSRKNMTLLLTEGEIEDIRHIAGMLSKPRTTLDETLKKAIAKGKHIYCFISGSGNEQND